MNETIEIRPHFPAHYLFVVISVRLDDELYNVGIRDSLISVSALIFQITANSAFGC